MDMMIDNIYPDFLRLIKIKAEVRKENQFMRNHDKAGRS